jgi:AMMECR1 domain-containing protein
MRVPVIIALVLAAATAHAEPYGRAFKEAAQVAVMDEGRSLVALARKALEAAVRGEPLPEVQVRADEPAPFGVFVTVVRNRKVRGCFGFMDPGAQSMAAMVVDAAHGAARLDVRNRPIAQAELADSDIIVSIVGPAEPIESIAAIDPFTMGLLVRSGTRAAVLLPGEARTAQWQLAEARRKAGIAPTDQVQLFRFPTITLIEHELIPPISKGEPE